MKKNTRINYLKILTGCSKTDLKIIDALIDYTQMGVVFRSCLYKLEHSKATPKEYEFLDTCCYKIYMTNEYKDYINTKNQELGVGVYHDRNPNKIKDYGYWIREFGIKEERAYKLLDNFMASPRWQNIDWVDYVMSYKEFEKYFLGF